MQHGLFIFKSPGNTVCKLANGIVQYNWRKCCTINTELMLSSFVNWFSRTGNWSLFSLKCRSALLHTLMCVITPVIMRCVKAAHLNLIGCQCTTMDGKKMCMTPSIITPRTTMHGICALLQNALGWQSQWMAATHYT